VLYHLSNMTASCFLFSLLQNRYDRTSTAHLRVDKQRALNDAAWQRASRGMATFPAAACAGYAIVWRGRARILCLPPAGIFHLLIFSALLFPCLRLATCCTTCKTSPRRLLPPPLTAYSPHTHTLAHTTAHILAATSRSF